MRARPFDSLPLRALAALAPVALAGCTGDAGAGATTPPADVPRVSTSAGDGPSRWVDPFIGTANAKTGAAVLNGGAGSVFPGASMPFGMVELSPDTPSAAPPGYDHADTTVLGFNFTHLSGAGCLAMRDVPLLPIVGALDPSNDPSAGFSHGNELASPGFYEALLDSGVLVDLTATTRTGLARFTFPRTPDAKVLLRAGYLHDASEVFEFDAKVAGPDLVVGHRDDGFFCASNTRYRVWFAARFDRPFGDHGTWDDGGVTAGAAEATGRQGGLYLAFDAQDDPVVEVKVGLSYVSADGALANLAAESPGWDFDAVHAAAHTAWDERLGRIEVEGGTDDERTSFETGLYHAMLEPSVASDADGRHLGFDGTIAEPDGHARYSLFSGWDAYRSWIQLAALVAPDEASDLARSLVEDGAECGAIPKWPIGNQDSSTMVGDPAAPALASAYAFGVRGFDAKRALELLLHAANDPKAACGWAVVRDDLADYLARGYCPIDAPNPAYGPVSTTMEYAIDDFSIAMLADALGDAATKSAMLARGRNWQKVFDPAREALGQTGYPQPRKAADAGGKPAFVEVDVTNGDGFVEGNAAQYTFMVPHDVPGVVAAVGGEAAALARLDAFFTEVNAGTEAPHLYIGNEPGFWAPWAYAFVGAPSRTQALVRRILREAFAPTPGGLPGNDDLGATSAWQVWAMLGLYPAIPGVGGFVLGSPTFPKATVTLPGGKKLVIVAKGGEGGPYVQSATLDGKAHSSAWLPWSAVAGGAELDFTLGAAASPTWGAGVEARPPRFYP
jgi:predicted alpha-1,2-mannosidase